MHVLQLFWLKVHKCAKINSFEIICWYIQDYVAKFKKLNLKFGGNTVLMIRFNCNNTNFSLSQANPEIIKKQTHSSITISNISCTNVVYAAFSIFHIQQTDLLESLVLESLVFWSQRTPFKITVGHQHP